MSFCQDTKKELIAVTEPPCCRGAKLYAALLLSGKIDSRALTVHTESRAVCEYICQAVHEIFFIDPQVQTTQKTNGQFFRLVIAPTDALYRRFTIDPHNPYMKIQADVRQKSCCRRAFLRGAFLGAGQMTDPVRAYNLEFAVSKQHLAEGLAAVLTQSGYPPGIVRRAGKTVLYYHASEHIEDLLTLMGAPDSAFALMNIKIEKDVRNNINRRGNCDLANAEKQAEAAVAQLRDIEALTRAGKLPSLPPQLRELAVLRRDNPELSLQELGNLCDPPISKSSVTRRFTRLREYLNPL